ncbi:unnamed protein product [marine sediment metagenome]|uniref:Uncharacterized protein n=1 Tax=marine sediment metagenome TaxID=412755 RepID=X0X2V7_9ZZZZ
MSKIKEVPLSQDAQAYERMILESANTCTCCGHFLTDEVAQQLSNGYKFVSCSICGQVADDLR